MKSVAIVGVGLIGGSFGLALRKAGFDGDDSGRQFRAQYRAGASSAAPSTAARRSKKPPAPAICCSFRSRSRAFSRRCGSWTRWCGRIRWSRMREAPNRPSWTRRSDACGAARFSAAIPMAGKEQRGAAAADADLFRGRPWILTSDLDHPIPKMDGGVRRARDRSGRRAARSPSGVEFSPAAAGFDGAGFRDRRSRAGSGNCGWTGSARCHAAGDEFFRSLARYSRTNNIEISSALDAYIEKLQALRGDLEGEFRKGSEFCALPAGSRIIAGRLPRGFRYSVFHQLAVLRQQLRRSAPRSAAPAPAACWTPAPAPSLRRN